MGFRLFDFTDYREYLNSALSERGKKKQFAEFIACQTTFLSSVLAGQVNMSLEHAMRAAEFFELNEKETHFLMLIVQYEKAGTQNLKNYYWRQIETLKLEQSKISNRVTTHDTIPLHEQAIFYNSWIYVGIHILCAVPEFQTRRALANRIRIPAAQLNSIIDFMLGQGMIREDGDKIVQGPSRVHLPKGSPFLVKHHSNWRMKAIQSFDYERENDMHYTMVMSLSKKDVAKMQEFILELVSNTDTLIKTTGDEIVYSLCVDWFQV